MNRLEHFLLRCWYQRGVPLWPLTPLEWLWRGVAAWRRRQLRREPVNRVPIIVVGNITVGGTGKTPVVIALAQHLHGQGFKPGIVSRGYGGVSGTRPRLVTADTPVDIAGDEPALMARRTGLPIAVSRQRATAAECLINEHGCNVIISDDGLQHYALPRVLEIAMIDGLRGLGNRRCLPIGPLREAPQRLSSVDYVLVSGTVLRAELPPGVTAEFAITCPVKFVNVKDRREVSVNDWTQQGEIHAVAGIGNPQRFFATLAELGIECNAHAFPDHHDFATADIQFNDAAAIIMTEKDAVKCTDIATDRHWYLQIESRLPQALLDAVVRAAQGAH